MSTTTSRAPTPSSALALRAIVLVAPLLAVWATAVQGPAPRPLLVVLVAVLALGAVSRPDSVLLALCLGVVLVWWALAAHHEVPVSMVPAAWAVLAAHLAATLLGHGPRELAVGRDLLVRWRWRAALLAAMPPALWLLAAGVHGRQLHGAWLGGLLGAVAVCLVAAAAVRPRTPR